jgi:hypothetical protein
LHFRRFAAVAELPSAPPAAGWSLISVVVR